jgi:putative ABC transport system permease protein
VNITLRTGFRYLVKNKKRTLLTVFGIIMSVALICGTALLGDNLKLQGVRTARRIYGGYHVMFGALSDEQARMLKSNVKIERCGFSRIIGTADIGGGAVLRVEGRDKSFCGLRAETLAVGSWPENSSQIAIEQWAWKMLGNPGLGSTIELDLHAAASAFAKRYVLSGIIENRSWSRRSSTALAVSGFSLQAAADGSAGADGAVSDQAAAEGSTAAHREPAGKTADEKDRITAAVTFKQGTAIQKAVADLQREYGLGDNAVMQNDALLGAMRESRLLRANNAVFITELIFILIIVVVTVGVIYNSFAISVAERNREFGLLRAAGADPGQIRRIVFLEAFLLSLIGIPFGLFFGIAAIKIVFLIAGFGEVGLNLSRIDVRPAVPVVAALIGSAAVFLSALLPGLNAGRISPMAAILNRRNASVRRRRRGPLVRVAALFGLEGELALLNIGRSRKKFLVTLFSLCIGVCLFITFSSFADLMRRAMESSLGDPLVRDVTLDQWPHDPALEIPPALVEEIRAKPYVDSLMKVRYGRSVLFAEEDRFEAEYLRRIETERISGFEPDDQTGEDATAVPVDVFGLGKDEFEAFAAKISAGSIQYSEFKNGALLWPRYYGTDRTRKALSAAPGDSIRIAGYDAVPAELQISALVDQPPAKGDMRAFAPVVIVGEDVFKRITGRSGYSLLGIELSDTIEPEQAVSELEALTERTRNINVTDHQGAYRRQRDLIRQMEILFFGLVTVVSLIGMVNIVNTINTNIILRVQEFGTLRAVGMTGRQLKIMVVTEGIITALAAVIVGSAAGIGLSRLFFSNINTVQSIVWSIPWKSIGIAAAAAVVLGTLSSLPPFKRISRMTVVDAIRTIE